METEKYPHVICRTQKNSDIVFVEFLNNLKIDLKTAKEIVANRLSFTKGKKHYLLIDMSKVRQISSEAKEFMQRPEAGLKNILGAAFVTSNPVSVLIASIFIKTTKDFDARFFRNEEDALDWIYDYRQTIRNNVKHL